MPYIREGCGGILHLDDAPELWRKAIEAVAAGQMWYREICRRAWCQRSSIFRFVFSTSPVFRGAICPEPRTKSPEFSANARIEVPWAKGAPDDRASLLTDFSAQTARLPAASSPVRRANC